MTAAKANCQIEQLLVCRAKNHFAASGKAPLLIGGDSHAIAILMKGVLQCFPPSEPPRMITDLCGLPDIVEKKSAFHRFSVMVIPGRLSSKVVFFGVSHDSIIQAE